MAVCIGSIGDAKWEHSLPKAEKLNMIEPGHLIDGQSLCVMVTITGGELSLLQACLDSDLSDNEISCSDEMCSP